MSEQLFREIKEIEKEAEQIISESEKRSAELLKQANEEAFKTISGKDSDLKKIRDQEIAKALKDAEKSKEKKLVKNKEALDTLKSAAEKKKDKAANLILDRLLELIGE